jgi:hypothetical protein
MAATRMIALGLAAALLAGPAAASDLLYRHAGDGPDLLEGSDGRPYWVLLSECAGFYGAMANMATSEADYERDLATGRTWLNLAIERVVSDRAIGRAEAIALVEPRVSGARSIGQSGLARSGDGESGIGLTAGQVMRSSCGSLERIYRARAG